MCETMTVDVPELSSEWKHFPDTSDRCEIGDYHLIATDNQWSFWHDSGSYCGVANNLEQAKKNAVLAMEAHRAMMGTLRSLSIKQIG